MTLFDFMRERLLKAKGLLEPPKLNPKFSFKSLEQTEWSPEFEQLMRNRLIMGALRYGLLNDISNKPSYDRMASIKKRADKYAETGNLEFLVDMANLCLLEFEEGQHPKKHFHAIDDGEHVSCKAKNKA